MKYLSHLILMVVFFGCVQSRDRQTSLDVFNGSGANFSDGFIIPDDNNNGDSNNNDNSDIKNDDIDIIQPGFSHCNFSSGYPFRVSEQYLGTISVCQKLGDQQLIAIEANINHSPESPICIVPTWRNQYNESIYVGPEACMTLDANRMQFIAISKFPNFDSVPINGAIIIKQNRLSAYRNCIDAIPGTPEKSILCNDFIANGGFLDFSFTTYQSTI